MAYIAGKASVTAHGVGKGTTATRFWADILLRPTMACFISSMSPFYLMLGKFSPTENRPLSPCFRVGSQWYSPPTSVFFQHQYLRLHIGLRG